MFRLAIALAACLLASVCAASESSVLERHPDGRPAAIEALGHTVRFGTQSGASCDDAIVLADAKDKASRIRSQHVWLDAVYPGWTEVDYRVMWSTPPAPKRAFSKFDIKDAKGQALVVCFDVSDPLVAEAEALDAQPKVEFAPITDAELPRQLTRCAVYYDLDGRRMTDAAKGKQYQEIAKVVVQMARVRGGTQEQVSGWLREVEGEMNSGGSPTLLAEWNRCPALFKEQVEKLQAEGKVKVTP
jgi:hypothetical protein